MNYAAKWNKIDSFIFFCESKIARLKAAIADSRASAPDTELMIQAETEYLRSENESLKKREIPVYLIEENENFICPKCQSRIMDADAKYCGSCGHRVMRHIPINYAL